jgi:hypothetical protein
MTGLGVSLTGMRHFSEAIAAHETAIGIFRETRDRHGEALALDNLGIPLRETARLRNGQSMQRGHTVKMRLPPSFYTPDAAATAGASIDVLNGLPAARSSQAKGAAAAQIRRRSDP